MMLLEAVLGKCPSLLVQPGPRTLSSAPVPVDNTHPGFALLERTHGNKALDFNKGNGGDTHWSRRQPWTVSENSHVLSLLLGLSWAFSMNSDFQVCFDGCRILEYGFGYILKLFWHPALTFMTF